MAQHSQIHEPHVHNCIVTYSRPWQSFFRKRYWARCIEGDCDYRDGPWPSTATAWLVAYARSQ